jgi:serine/threonine protein kinase/Tfp pilus assembly protein PilF
VIFFLAIPTVQAEVKMNFPHDPDEHTLPPSDDSTSSGSDAATSSAGSPETLLPADSSAPFPESSPSFPRTIGPYRLVRKLGEGGMGQVWLAEQTAPLQRLVAIKLVRAGITDNVLLDRFESERQALARMNHPAIAKVFDAGTTPDGTPYFVMEYVPGIPITLYCDQKRFSIPQRLELFIKVCAGVQHAHQKAIIHRDLKPANILVTELDGKPAPRIIDFGIAKAIAARDPLATMFTRAGNFIGTPSYMSPEQADPDVRDVDTRSDVYSLAVILYELLTGTLPFDPTQWRSEVVYEALKRLREQDPPPPSIQYARKSTTDRDTATQTAHLRSTDPQNLVSLLRGDLDWIAMKALEKDRARRYGTPSELTGDLLRYLNHEPVSARPASAAYRLQKYVRRHRLAVSVAGAGLVLLIAFAAMQAIQIRRITAERDRTARERDRANRISDFMTKMFKVSDPSEARGNSITAREVLDSASKDIDSGLAEDPELQARMMDIMGTVYDNLGLYPRAEALTRRSLDILRKSSGEENTESLRLENNLGNILYDEGHYAESEKLYRHAFESFRRQLGPENMRTLQTMDDLANAVYEQGRYTESEKLYRDALEISRRSLGPDHRETLIQYGNLANNLDAEGRYADAEALVREVLDARRRTLGPDHPETIRAMNDLAATLFLEGKYADAEALFRQTLDLRRRVEGPDHPETLLTIYNIAGAVQKQGRFAEAEKLYREALAAQTRVLGPENPDAVRTMTDLANTLADEGQFPSAIKLTKDALEMQRRTLGPEHPLTLQVLTDLGWTLHQAGQLAEAEKITREALAAQRRVLGPEHPATLSAQDNLANILQAEHRYTEAESLSRQTLEIRRRVLGLDHPDTAASAYNLACLAALQGHRDAAFTLLQEAIDHGLSPTGLAGMEKDADLKSLHSDPRFATLVASVAKKTVPTSAR